MFAALPRQGPHPRAAAPKAAARLRLFAAFVVAAALTLGLSAGAASASLAQRPPSSGGNTGDGNAMVAMAGFQTITEGYDPTGTGGSSDPGH